MSGHHGEGGGEHGKAIEHYRAIEHYLADPIHADRELYERWPGDAEGHKDFDRWQSFKRDSNWTAWHTAERERMQREFARSVDEAETYRRITLRQPPQQGQPSHPMGRLFESHLASAGARQVPAFIGADLLGRERWGVLSTASAREAARDSSRLRRLWEGYFVQAINELRASGADRAIEAGLSAPGGLVTSYLDAWDQLLRTTANPSVYEFSPFFEADRRWGTRAGERVHPLDAFLKAHAAAFGGRTAPSAPTALYRLPAVLGAIAELQGQQVLVRSEPYSYSKLYARLSEVPRPLPPTDPNALARLQGMGAEMRGNYPATGWQTLMVHNLRDGMRAELGRERTVAFWDPHFAGRGDRDLANARRNIDAIQNTLHAWWEGPRQLAWPVRPESFRALSEIAMYATNLREEFEHVFPGSEPHHAAVRELMSMILDTLMARLQRDLATYASQ